MDKDIERAQDIEFVFDRLTHSIGFFKGIATVLRSSGDVDPLTLSGNFEDISRDLLVLKDKLIDLLYSDDEEDEVEEDD